MLSKPNCHLCQFKDLCIRQIPLFSSLSDDELIKIFPLIQHHTYQKGEILINDKDPLDSLILINEGKVKASKYSFDGKEQILHVFFAKDFFGEQFLTNERSSFYTIEALTQVKVCVLAKKDFDQIVIKHPNIATNLISQLYKRLRKLESTIYHLNIRSVDNRVNALLINYTEEYGHLTSNGIVIDLPLNREQMANYLGITRETISRKLSQLENENIILTLNRKQILIKDLARLQELITE